MFSNDIRNGIAVNVRIGQGDLAPLVPGVVTDARVGTRELIRSAAKGGAIQIQNSVSVISVRQNMNPGNGRPDFYYVERPEALIALSPRTVHVPAIDGDGTVTTGAIIQALRMQVAMSRAALAPAPSATKAEADASPFLAMPALALA